MREFTRVAWASDRARAVWEPRVQAIQAAWLDVELTSVAEGLRPAALVFDRSGLFDRARLLGLEMLAVAPDRFAVGRSADPDILAVAYRERHDELVGQMLGFPVCCRVFFERVWNQLQKRDTTPHMEGADRPGYRETNILGRWLGVRTVPHLPCSFRCQASHAFALQLQPLWPARELAWALEILSWPVRYSALHGITIITMPVVKVVTDTDYTATELRIDRHGTAYPVEAANGLEFPFQAPAPLIDLSVRLWTDNGFSSRQAMDHAHTQLLARVPAGVESVIDLGAGNGILLERIGARRSMGLESVRARAIPGAARGVLHGYIEDVPDCLESFDLAIIARRRLLEMTPGRAHAVLTWLRTHARLVLLYSYDVDPVEVHMLPSGSLHHDLFGIEAFSG